MLLAYVTNDINKHPSLVRQSLSNKLKKSQRKTIIKTVFESPSVNNSHNSTSEGGVPLNYPEAQSKVLHTQTPNQSAFFTYNYGT